MAPVPAGGCGGRVCVRKAGRRLVSDSLRLSVAGRRCIVALRSQLAAIGRWSCHGSACAGLELNAGVKSLHWGGGPSSRSDLTRALAFAPNGDNRSKLVIFLVDGDVSS